MHIVDALQEKPEKVEAPEAQGVEIQWLIDEQAGAENFAMRRFLVEAGGHTPLHEHDWEHEVYVLEGKGALVTEAGELEIQPGRAVLVPGGEKHQFRAGDEGRLVFLCLVPNGPATQH